ncbi:PAS domain-containing protein [Streptomyces sp. TR02-1]|uniref:PAS domain-containing protein n=1 Tax=Streptomyces sp. TR02-1 TaxID=3385977 RepID=UPI0039A1BC03
MSSRPPRGAARLAAILDALPDALLLVNCNGTVVNANAIALEALEAPGTALVGRGLLDLLPEFDPNRIPGSMRRPDEDEVEARTKPTRMTARRTDGSEFPVEVTSASLEDGRTPYASSFEAAWADHGTGSGTARYTGDELLMLVVRDLTGTLDTEAELARQQRQTEMILRAASEGVVGVDTEGRVVLVNPSAAQILGFRAGDLGGKELHPLVHHSRPDGSALPFEETPLHDTLRSGRKHRVRAGQVLWAKDGTAVPVAMTTAPVRDGDQLVGAVLTFTDRRPYVTLRERHEQLRAVLDDALRGPLDQFRDELGGLAADPAGQLWPEANQILHHLSAGYARMTTLVDNVLAFQRLQTGKEKLRTERVSLDNVVAAGVEGAVELIGPGRAQFAVHAPPIEAEVDPERLATALAHLIADVGGVDATGAQNSAAAGGDSTIVVAAAQRGEVVRIEVRGPHSGGSPVHEPVVRGIVERHGGVLQTHDVPGSGGSAYVLEVPCAASAGTRDASASADAGTDGAGTAASGGPDGSGGLDTAGAQVDNETTVMPVPTQPMRGTGAPPAAAVPAARQPEDGASVAGGQPSAAGGTAGAEQQGARPTGRRRRGRPDPAEQSAGSAGTAEGKAPGTALALPGGSQDAQPAEHREREAWGGSQTTGRRARRALAAPSGTGDGGPPNGPTTQGQGAPALPRAAAGPVEPARQHRQNQQNRQAQQAPQVPQAPGPGQPGTEAQHGGGPLPQQVPPGTGRRGRRPQEASAQEVPGGASGPPGQEPQQPAEHAAAPAPGGRRARRLAAAQARADEQAAGRAPSQEPFALPPAEVDRSGDPRTARQSAPPAGQAAPNGQAPAAPGEVPAGSDQVRVAASPILGGGHLPEQAARHGDRPALPMPNGHGGSYGGEQDGTGGISVRTLGQGVPFARRVAEQGQGQGHRQGHAPGQEQRQGSGVADAPPSAAPSIPSTPSSPAPQPGSGRRRKLATPGGEQPAAPAQGAGPAPAAPPPQPQGPGRQFAVGAPEAGAAEGPELLDGPNGAVEVTDGGGMPAQSRPADDELPPEPLDNPRRLLVWPEPDVSTQQALSERGYRPVIVNSREEVDAQIAAYPAALFVDPLTGPITRKALQSLRQAAVAAEVPVLVTAGLGQASREAAYGADPAVLLKALAPRDSEQHPPRVLLVEEKEAVAAAFCQSLERRGVQVAHAPTDTDAVHTAAQFMPNLVVMDLMQVRRRRAGIIDLLRVNGVLHRTPFVVYTSSGIDEQGLAQLASGENVLFLAERSTNDEVQARIVDLLAKIGAH